MKCYFIEQINKKHDENGKEDEDVMKSVRDYL